MTDPLVLVVLGVSGSGKSTIGRMLADQLGWSFADADAFHPAANVEKMHARIPLTDTDRAPWLSALRGLIEASLDAEQSLILACSALKQAYRDRLRVDSRVRFIYLRGDYVLLAARMAARSDHFMPPGLLQSQFDALEEPRDALWVEVSQPPAAVVASVLERLREDDLSSVR